MRRPAYSKLYLEDKIYRKSVEFTVQMIRGGASIEPFRNGKSQYCRDVMELLYGWGIE